MSELLTEHPTPSDAELISLVRGGDNAAYGELFDRHRAAAERLARQLVRGPDSDDLVSEAFIKVLQVLGSGGGPDVAFRAYLLTAVRRLHIDRVRSAKRVQPSDDMEKYDDGVPFQDTAVDGFERSATARAFASLPERWQLVLWHLEVEGNKPAEVAPLLGMSANSVSALGYRAREGLRQAYLQMHLADTADEHCRWTTEHLGGYVRSGLSRRDSLKVDHHLQDCRRCTGLYLELTEVNANLGALLAPALLGTLAAGYLASTAAAASGGLAGAGLLTRLVDSIKSGGNATAGGVAVGAVVAVAVAAIAVSNIVGSDETPSAKPPPSAEAPPNAPAEPPADEPPAAPPADSPPPPVDEPPPPAEEPPPPPEEPPAVVPPPAPEPTTAPPEPTSTPTSTPTPKPKPKPKPTPTPTPPETTPPEVPTVDLQLSTSTMSTTSTVSSTSWGQGGKESVVVTAAAQDEVRLVRVVFVGHRVKVTASSWACSSSGPKTECVGKGRTLERFTVRRATGAGFWWFGAVIDANGQEFVDPNPSNNKVFWSSKGSHR
ncbi:MAG: sigma-70 family RNA polymerase sigma factor [Nocardioidaceae bacterium]